MAQTLERGPPLVASNLLASRNMRVISLSNTKGGVGKTAVALGLGHALVRAGQRVLLIDMDPNPTASRILARDHTGAGIDELLDQPDAGLAAVAVPTSWGFDLAAGSTNMASREHRRQIGEEMTLRAIIEASGTAWDWILLDVGRDVGQLCVTSLLAADHSLIVTTPDAESVDSVADMLATIAGAQRLRPAAAHLAGVIVNLRARTKVHDHFEAVLREDLGDDLWSPSIPRLTAWGQATGSGEPISAVRHNGARTLTVAFDALATTLQHRTHNDKAA